MTTRSIAKASGTRGLLNRILGEPRLVSAIQNLDAKILSRLIQHVGLEDSGEIVALATTHQLKKIFDEDLWRSEKPGHEERFDAERFGVWLQIMLEMGSSFAARKLSEMDEDFLTMALGQQVIVVDMDELCQRVSNRTGSSLSDEDLMEKALESSLYMEFEGFSIISKNPLCWDAVLTVLVALDGDHHDFFVRLLERCCYFSAEYIEDNGGLYRVLTAGEQLETDVAFEREQRREKEGFVVPQSAAAFLKLSRDSLDIPDLISSSYFKTLPMASPRSQKNQETGMDVSHFISVLSEAGVIESSQKDAGNALIRETLGKLRNLDPDLFARLMEELNYLANVLVSGCSLEGRPLRPSEAAEAALATCNLGLEKLTHREEMAGNSEKVWDGESLLEIFRVGWHLLYSQVILASAVKFQAELSSMTYKSRIAQLDPWLLKQVMGLEAEFGKWLILGTPWACLDDMDILQVILDVDKIDILKELLDECPRINGKFISTRQELSQVQVLLNRVFE